LFYDITNCWSRMHRMGAHPKFPEPERQVCLGMRALQNKRSEMVLIAILLCSILVALSGVHVYWALGGTGGKGAVIPEDGGRPLLKPRPVVTFGIAGGLALAAAVAALRGGLFGPAGDHVGVCIAAGALGVLFVARAVGERHYVGLFKRVKGTRFARWDTWLFTPLCVIIAAGFLTLCCPT
jgi:hypothetical protein